MTYNRKMRRISVWVGTGLLSSKVWKTGSLAWFLAWAGIAGAVIALGISIRQAAISGDYRSIVTHQTITHFVTIGFALVGGLVASRRPRNPIGWIFMAVSILYSLVSLTAAAIMVSPPASPFLKLAHWLSSWLWIPANLLPVMFVSMLFPDGYLLSPRWRFVAWSAALGLVLTILGVMFFPGQLAILGLDQPNPYGIPGAAPILNPLLAVGMVFLAIGVSGSLAALLVRYRRSAGIQREQIKWLVYALGISVILSVLTSLFAGLWPGFRWGLELSIVVTNLCILGFAVAAMVAILRYRLYDIDLIINRTLVYTALTVSVAACYGLVVGGLGAVFQTINTPLLSVLATGLAAILIQPARDGLQRLVNRVMYGERDDPYAVLSRLGRRLESSLAPDATLPTVVETVAQALKLPYVAIALKQGGDLKIAASYGLAGAEQIQLPLIYQGETIGQLRLSARSADEPFSPAERRLLKDIARHIGVAARTVLLTQDLQRSREELVKSREEERRRLRRDLHDELGPQLASLKLNLDVAHTLVSRDPSAAESLLLDLRSKSQSAIADIRRLVYDLRPPALDELGLTGAIQEYGRQIESKDGLSIRWGMPEPFPPLSAAVEVAAYRIIIEALANIVRHSHGQNCQVSISMIENTLQVEVCDDGLGLPENLQPGVGLNSMRERAAELGGTCVIQTLPQGGTRVLARLPME